MIEALVCSLKSIGLLSQYPEGLRLSREDVGSPLQSHAPIVARLESNEFISDTPSINFKVFISIGDEGNLLHPDD